MSGYSFTIIVTGYSSVNIKKKLLKSRWKRCKRNNAKRNRKTAVFSILLLACILMFVLVFQRYLFWFFLSFTIIINTTLWNMKLGSRKYNFYFIPENRAKEFISWAHFFTMHELLLKGVIVVWCPSFCRRNNLILSFAMSN